MRLQFSLRTLFVSFVVIGGLVSIIGNSIYVARADNSELVALQRDLQAVGGVLSSAGQARRWTFGLPGTRFSRRGTVRMRQPTLELMGKTVDDRRRALKALSSPDVTTLYFRGSAASFRALLDYGAFTNLTSLDIKLDDNIEPQPGWIKKFPNLAKLSIEAPGLTDDQWCFDLASFSAIKEITICNGDFTQIGWDQMSTIPLKSLSYYYSGVRPKWRLTLSGKFVETIEVLAAAITENSELRKLRNCKRLAYCSIGAIGTDPAIDNELRRSMPHVEFLFQR